MAFSLLIKFLSSLFKKKNAPWVIGGHRGYLYADNSAALHSYIVQHTKQQIIWIAANPLYKKLKREKIRVLKKDSLRAKLAVARAPVLIYSHGKDDLDTFLKKFEMKTGTLIYLNHSMNFLKTSKNKVCADFLLAVSEEEKNNFSKDFTGIGNIFPEGGGAHLDGILKIRNKTPENLILWFPTWRDTKEEAERAVEFQSKVLSSAKLCHALEKNNLCLALVTHINSAGLSNSPHKLISLHNQSDLTWLLEKACVFVSDYSGSIFDWLALDRPAVFFPFDFESFQKSRKFYYPLEDIYYGPVVRTEEEFLEIFSSGAWKDMEAFAEKRKFWRDKVFSQGLQPVYSKKCYEVVRGLGPQ
ncbi:MAG: CDP-glycerol glycerophosphotransferase family protein [Fibromonadales bacterium]|nr:CDP-glycerol glycerophosphotransferase family protein [Fibromonadales bacterium]